MSKSKLLKEAIADAKAVRETAIANAKIALEEAFTPRLQAVLSRKLQAEMEDFDDEDEMEMEEEYGAEDVTADHSSEIGDGGEPEGIATYSHTELDPETDEETAEVGFEEDEIELAEEDEMEFDFDSEEDEDELDLEAIIRELEGDVDGDDVNEYEDENLDGVMDDPTGATMEEGEDEMEFDMDDDESDEMEFDDEIDLDEILREMGYGSDDEDMSEEEEEEEPAVDNTAELEADLEEAYTTIKSLKKTINEVNLLNAKLLYTNKLFRSYNLTNEQKVKVVENLDRTSNVREVKLVYATLAESMKFTGTERKIAAKKNVTEGLASKTVASTAPKKEIISENVDTIADRFKKLAGII